MKIKNSQVLDGLATLQKLEPEGKSKYKFGMTTRLSFAKNVNKLMKRNEVLQKVREKALQEKNLGQYAVKDDNGSTKEDPEALKRFIIEWTSVMEQEEEVPLTPIKISELRLEENEIPFCLIAPLLGWIIQEEE